MSKFCVDVAKFVVFFVNFVALGICGVLLCLCVYVFVKADDVLGSPVVANLSAENPSALLFSLFLIAFVVFGFLVLFTFLGCCGAACLNRCMLGSFLVILFTLIGGYVGLIAYVYVVHNSEYEFLVSQMQKSIRYYDVKDESSLLKQFWDAIQQGFKCCGAAGFADWKECEGLMVGRKVPNSCCRLSEDCVFDPDESNAYIEGCIPMNQLNINLIFWGIFLTMVSIFILSMALCLRPRLRSHPAPRHRKHVTPDAASQYSEETGYVYRGGGAIPLNYNPPYNPNYHSNNSMAPPEYQKPLLPGSAVNGDGGPPPYHDVAR